LPIKLHPLAEQDLKIALDYYYAISPNLEKRFLAYLEKYFDRIGNTPNLYPYETQTSQKAVMKKFPYIVLYEQYDGGIMILAIFHTRQNPKGLSKRAEV
jgi:plasmid stabilization system protein ParE